VNILLYCECIKLEIGRGSTHFGSGRGTIGSGTHHFKKQWGADATRLYWHYWLCDDQAMPQLNPENATRALAICAWQEMSMWAANFTGPRIVRHLP
jgi:hypothetical protein